MTLVIFRFLDYHFYILHVPSTVASGPPMNNDEQEKQIAGEPDLLRRERAPQTSEKLRESEAKYRLLVENAGEGILVAQDGILRLANPKLQEMVGYSEQELTAKPFTAFLHPDDRDMVVRYHQKRQRGELQSSSTTSGAWRSSGPRKRRSRAARTRGSRVRSRPS